MLYCNLLAALPMFLLGYVNNDYDDIFAKLATLDSTATSLLLFSCVAGTLIGYTGWLCRSMVSATTYTLVGVVNKFLTVLLNAVVWDQHSSPFGIACVCICLLAGTLYQQAPKTDAERKPAAEGSTV
ncbi:hypothetical protein EON64_09870 [archaeon]|nr:MAG: hypothetical protein EON64_09870 [archaeon]